MRTHRKLSSVTVAHMRLLREEGHTYEQIAGMVQRSISVVHRALCGYRGDWNRRN